MNFTCPLPVAPSDIPNQDCPFKMDQVVKFTLQRRGSDDVFYPVVGTTPGKPIADLSSWQGYNAATDATKMIYGPNFAGYDMPSSEAQTEGGNTNDTINGIPVDLGEGFVQVSGVFRNISPEVKKALDDLRGYSQASLGVANLTIFLFNIHKSVFCYSGSAADTYVGIPIFNFRVGSRSGGQFNQDDQVPFSFMLPAFWDQNLVTAKVNFDPLFDLKIA